MLRYAGYGLGAWVVVWAFTQRNSGPAEGSQAADFTLPSVVRPGKSFELAAHRGTPVLLEVFAEWCSACERATPTIVQAHRAERRAPVRFVGVSVDSSPRAAERARREWNIPYEVVHDDGRVSAAYNVRVLPTFVLIDAEGRVVNTTSGGISTWRLEGWLSELGAERVQ